MKPLRAKKEQKPAKTAKAVCTVYDDKTIGSVQITEDVLATIAAIAATDVEGVAYVGGSITRDKAAKASSRAIAKGVKVEVSGDTLTVRVIIIVKYGSRIPETTVQVQQKVKSTLESMTGLHVAEVHVSVADVAPDAK